MSADVVGVSQLTSRAVSCRLCCQPLSHEYVAQMAQVSRSSVNRYFRGETLRQETSLAIEATLARITERNQ